MQEAKYETVTLKFLVPDEYFEGLYYGFISKEVMLAYADLQDRAGGKELADEFRRCAKKSDEAAKRKEGLSSVPIRLIKDGKIY